MSYGLGFLGSLIEERQPFAGFLDGFGGSSFVVGPSVPDTNFHHYAYVRSASTNNLFIDGDSVGRDPGDTFGDPLFFGGLLDPEDPTRLEAAFAGL